jgi:hypothetical protein
MRQHFTAIRVDRPATTARACTGTISEAKAPACLLFTRPVDRFATCLEEFVTPFGLAVLGILNFQPRRAATVALIRALAPLSDDALEIVLARNSKEAASTHANRLYQPRVGAQHDARESLSLHQGQIAEIFAVDEQYVERQELPPITYRHYAHPFPIMAVFHAWWMSRISSDERHT